jgi:hypothetical protein
VRSPRRRPPAAINALRRERISAGWREFRREIDRSRRHERPFTMISIPIEPEAEDLLVLPALVASSVRTIDFVWEDGANLYVLMPETPREPALAAITRVTSRLAALRSREVRLAMFPDDASTAGALLDVLRGDGESSVPAGSTAPNRAGTDVVTADLIAGASLTTLPR